MPGMFGGGGMNGQDMLNLANQEAALNRTNTWSPIYGGTVWSGPGSNGGYGGGGGGGGGGGSEAPWKSSEPNYGPYGGWQPGKKYDPHTGLPADGSGGPGIGKWDGNPAHIGWYTGDAAPPAGNFAPQGGEWTQTQVLSPYMQQRFDLAQNLMGRVGSEMKPFDASGLPDLSMDPNFEQNQADQAFAYSKGYLDPAWAAQSKQMQGQLAAQGLHPGDPGYNQAMQQFYSGRNQAYDQARTGAYQTGVQAGATRMNTAVQSTQAQIARQLAESGWSLGQINALMAGLPPPPGGGGGQTNLLNAQLQNSLAQQQMQAQAANNLIGSAATIAGGAIAASDVNVKENFSDPAPAIEEFLQSAEPAEYNYKPDTPFASEHRHVSPMAQNLEQSKIGRSMVVEAPDGTKMVDYGKSFGALLGSLSHLNKKLNQVMGL